MKPFFFAYDNILDSRWGTIHLHHMVTLQEKNKKIYDELVQGNFVVHDSFRRFSDIALDQAHEHNNCLIKSDGGVIGITENESALLCWMTSSPAICQLIQIFSLVSNDQSLKSHHEVHKRFFLVM